MDHNTEQDYVPVVEMFRIALEDHTYWVCDNCAAFVPVGEQCPTCRRNEVIVFAESSVRDLVQHIDKITTQLRIAKHMNTVYKEQYLQQHENTLLLSKALSKDAPHDWYAVREQLHHNTTEIDKVVSDATYWKDKHVRTKHQLLELLKSGAGEDSSEYQQALILCKEKQP